MSDRRVLGVESAIAGGSISLTNNGVEIGSWIGEQTVSRAEDLLPNIDRLLRENDLRLRELDRIIVSTGPGSFTGIKVGISTVLGLRSAVGVTCIGLSILQALALNSKRETVTVAVPVGRGSDCVQQFSQGSETSVPELMNPDELNRKISASSSTYIVHGSFFDTGRFPNAIDAGWNMASHLCKAIDSPFATTDLTPLFVERKSSNI